MKPFERVYYILIILVLITMYCAETFYASRIKKSLDEFNTLLSQQNIDKQVKIWELEREFSTRQMIANMMIRENNGFKKILDSHNIKIEYTEHGPLEIAPE